MRIGAVQTPELLGDVPAALAVIESSTVDAAVDLLLFPECFLQGYLVEPDHLRAHALDLASPAFGAILAQLAPLPPTLVFGVIEERAGEYFNSAVVVTRGRLTGVYRKTHLRPGEALFTAGDAYPVFDLNGVRFGINICNDTNFPEAAAAVAAQGARVLLVPAQNMMRRAAAAFWQHRHHAVRAERARETGMWLVSADVTGERDRSRIALGPTNIISPQGTVIAQTRDREDSGDTDIAQPPLSAQPPHIAQAPHMTPAVAIADIPAATSPPPTSPQPRVRKGPFLV